MHCHPWGWVAVSAAGEHGAEQDLGTGRGALGTRVEEAVGDGLRFAVG